jgi:hypothetical protein
MDASRMPKQGDAVIHMLPLPDNKLQYLVGKSDGICVQPIVPYDGCVCEFLKSLSTSLLSDEEARRYPDVISFAYWCRKANINKLKQEFVEKHTRLGLGMVFHVTPSNVPINFAFSYIFSLLAGNANIVRLPTKDFPQMRIVCSVINRLFSNEKYKKIADMTVFVKYAQDDQITGAFSANCNARIIWGGDQAINNVRKLTIPERSIEVAFADRYSFCVIDGDSLLQADNVTLNRLAVSFYNDTYLMDQNACSSPHLIVWLGEGDVLMKAKERFWDSVYEVTASKYELQPVNVVDKYMLVCENAIELNNISGFKRHGNYLYRIELDSLPDDMDALRGKFGCFYEYNAENLDSVAHIINTRYQTLTYFGLDKSQLLDFVVKNRLSGIDRIVPIGSALDISVIWDGYDIVKTLSRVIDFR